MAVIAAAGLLSGAPAAAATPERTLDGLLEYREYRALLRASDAGESPGERCVTLIVPKRLRAEFQFLEGERVAVSGEVDELPPPEPGVFDRTYDGWPLEDLCDGPVMFVTAIRKATKP